MKVEQEVGAIWYKETTFGGDVLILQRFHFRKKSGQVDDNAIANNTNNILTKNAGGNQMERKLVTIRNNGVAYPIRERVW